MQITINLEQDIWEAACTKAHSQQTTLDQALGQLLRLGLAAETGASKKDSFTFSLPGG